MNMMVPPPCGSCGCSPCACNQFPAWAQGSLRMRQCMEELAALKCVIAQVLQEVGCPPVTGPILGVVDGSDAKQGFVGEFVTGSANLAFAAYPTVTTATLSPLVIQPGDWDVTGFMVPSTLTGAVDAHLSPLPAGMSNPMHGSLQTAGVNEENLNLLVLPSARLSCTLPTLLPFSVMIGQNISASLTAGVATLTIEARRRR